MASRIQGITVEIGGDTTKLQTALKGLNGEIKSTQTALKGLNGEIKSTQTQLKDVEKLLKMDPGNTELLAQKENLLAQAVAEKAVDEPISFASTDKASIVFTLCPSSVDMESLVTPIVA